MTRSSAVIVRTGIIVLTIATALIHFRQALLFPTPDPLFILNGLGYLGLLAALYLPIPQLSGHKRIIRFALIGFTALTFALFFIITGGVGASIAYIDKAIEAVLIVLLVVEARAESRRA
ncbi:MAG: hypothetical protein ACRDSJ_18580 [Rubrobacteraceae bacterium]